MSLEDIWEIKATYIYIVPIIHGDGILHFYSGFGDFNYTKLYKKNK